MKLLRVMFAMLLIYLAAAPLLTRPAGAASVDGVEAGADAGVAAGGDDGGAPAVTVGGSPAGRFSKGGVRAAVGCGFAIASLALMPNPVSAFIVGFDCGLMFIDAVDSPDR